MGTLAIQGARLIDGTGSEPLAKPVLVVEDGRIKQVGVNGQVALPADAKVVDLHDCTLMPGMMDLHNHISMFEVADYPTRVAEKAQRFETTPEAWQMYICKRLRRAVEGGFTVIRDTGGAPTTMMAALRDAADEGTIIGPRLVVPGLSVTTNSHLYHLTKFISRLPYPHVVANSPWEFRALVRQHLYEGADYIKTDASGGVGTPREPVNRRTQTQDELEAITDEAHALGRLVACHCHTPHSIRMAIEAGCDTIEHSAYMDEDALDKLVAHKKILVPTLTHRRDDSIAVNVRAGSHSTIIEKMKRVQEIYYETFQKLYRAGVKMACGTDAGFEPTAGESAIELGIYVDLGMKPMDAILTATRNAAEAIGRLDDLGTLEAGKLADIVAVQGNPLDNVKILEKLDNIKMVFRGGIVVADRRGDA